MTSKAALFALLATWGVGAAPALPAFAEGVATQTAAATGTAPLTDRVWAKAGDDGSQPGVIRIFLSDGTLVQDSCWETHRMSKWQMTSPTSVSWNEDGADISADIVSLTDSDLVLNLKLKGGNTQEEHYVAATVPYLCPDMPAN
jgi:hypothetical protein